MSETVHAVLRILEGYKILQIFLKKISLKFFVNYSDKGRPYLGSNIVKSFYKMHGFYEFPMTA